jgi:hypothetical protein
MNPSFFQRTQTLCACYIEWLARTEHVSGEALRKYLSKRAQQIHLLASIVVPWFIPLLIFVARVFDVSLGTLRTLLMITGHRALSALLGVAEVTVWIFAVGGAVKYLSHPMAVVGYASTSRRKLAIGSRSQGSGHGNNRAEKRLVLLP